eukprot:3822240-Pleurochrysis_carterae.AAC.3
METGSKASSSQADRRTGLGQRHMPGAASKNRRACVRGPRETAPWRQRSRAARRRARALRSASSATGGQGSACARKRRAKRGWGHGGVRAKLEDCAQKQRNAREATVTREDVGFRSRLGGQESGRATC